LYQQFFNFNTAPFSIAPDPHFIYMSEHHQEGLAHLLYGINQGGGFVALTGEVGTGKTTLCHCLLQQLPDNIEIALVLNPKVSAIELLATVCDELHIDYNKEKQTLKGLVDNLNKHLLATHAKGKRTVLVIDEAQNLSLNVLEQVRLLTNLETSTTKLLQIILLGQPELKILLEKPALRQLNQRITARYHLTSLSYSDTVQYIKHRLKLSGGNPNIFQQRAIKKIYALSKGIPRLINIICDRALLGAYANNTEFVSVKTINKAAKEVFNRENLSTKTVFQIVIFSVCLFAMLIGGRYLFKPKQEKPQHIILTGSFDTPTIEESSTDRKLPIDEPVKSTFNSVIKQQGFSFGYGVQQLAKIWGKEIQQDSDCKEVKAQGLSCLFDKASWSELILLNRPVIMEFDLNHSEKRYALLTGVTQGQPVFLFDKEISLPLEDVLRQWNGYYLMLWQPPIKSVTELSPNTNSSAVLWLRKHLGLNSKGTVFDQSLKLTIMAFQRSKHLIPDGIVGPRTFIHLLNTDPVNASPKLKGDQ